MTNVSPRGEGNPGISPARLENIPAGDQERSFDPLILGPIGNIPGRREYSQPDREYHRPIGNIIGPSGKSSAGGVGDIPGPIGSITGRREYPRPDR